MEQVAEREGCPLSFTDKIRFCFKLSDSEMSHWVLISPLWTPIVKSPGSVDLTIYPVCFVVLKVVYAYSLFLSICTLVESLPASSRRMIFWSTSKKAFSSLGKLRFSAYMTPIKSAHAEATSPRSRSTSTPSITIPTSAGGVVASAPSMLMTEMARMIYSSSFSAYAPSESFKEGGKKRTKHVKTMKSQTDYRKEKLMHWM